MICISKELPKVALLIASRNERNSIWDCVYSAVSQDYPSDKLEIYLIDGLSTDETIFLAKDAAKNYPNFYILSNEKIIQSAAWNLGIRSTKADLIGIVSAHSELAPDYVSSAVETLTRTHANMVGSPTRAESKGKVAEAIAISLSTPFGVGDARFHYTTNEIEVDTVFMGFCSRKVYDNIGGFDEEMIRNQDDEFSYRLLEQGGKIICNPMIKSFYHNRSTFFALWKQYFQYGLYKVRVLQKHPLQMRPRQFVPFFFVFGLLFLLILTLLYRWAVIFLVLLAASYFVVNLMASIIVASKRGWKYLYLFPVCYGILHFSYGIGFLAGLFKFWNRWGDKKGIVPEFLPQSV